MRFDRYVTGQRWVWAKVKELQDEYGLGEGIDVLTDALVLYEAHLKEKARDPRAQA